ncbi:DNA-3-methyladenine glycosylase family protein [Tessaracoccus palaemonis]|uniref:DNA-3-methyladenine glycosylase II n=1 Tax=Tessaracoccus palaemonis TaxID=2829499 RepID=A0ABX8SJ15_9ACTN|nr:AlkA N-terminal domain-containing protein [Tessaracoccus palaemonis]QXT63372.1 hypothetical protein KDB89_02485 [Tessaracoccus palaemonis]
MTTLHVAANGPFDPQVAFDTLARHTVVGLDRVDPATRTVFRLVDVGEVVAVDVTLDAAGATVAVDTRDEGILAGLRALVVDWFDLATDLAPINAHLAAAGLAASVAASPGMRLTRHVDAFEAAVLTVLGQRVSLAAARVIGSRLMAAFGTGDVAGFRLFPVPGALAVVPVDELRDAIGTPASRARTVHELAVLFAERGSTPPREELLALHGVGPWTVDLLEIRTGDDRDAFPVGDMVLQRSMAAAGIVDVASASAAWRPCRSYAAVRLWAMDPGPRRGGRGRSPGRSAPAQAEGRRP